MLVVSLGGNASQLCNIVGGILFWVFNKLAPTQRTKARLLEVRWDGWGCACLGGLIVGVAVAVAVAVCLAERGVQACVRVFQNRPFTHTHSRSLSVSLIHTLSLLLSPEHHLQLLLPRPLPLHHRPHLPRLRVRHPSAAAGEATT